MKYRTTTVIVLLLVLLISGFDVNTKAQGQTEKPKLNIAVLVFPKAQVIDYAGPIEVFRQFSQSFMPHNVYTVGEKIEAIKTNGPILVPDYSFSNHPKPDVLVIPGGGGTGLLKEQINDPILIKWIQDNARDAKYVLSVCNGAFILAKTGLLDGLSATTTAGLTKSLAEQNPKVKVVSDQRYVDNGKFITSAGLSSGIDASLHVIELLHGPAWARAVAMNMEYNWQPEINYVRAQLADMKMPASFYDVVVPSGKYLSTKGTTDYWQDEWSVKTEVPATEFLSKLNNLLVTKDKWSRIERPKEDKSVAASHWSFVDDEGQGWNGLINVKPGTADKELNVTIIITRKRSSSKGE